VGRSKWFPTGRVVRGNKLRHWGRWDRGVAEQDAHWRHNVVGHAISGRMDTMWRFGPGRRQLCDSVQRAYEKKDSGTAKDSIPTGKSPAYGHPYNIATTTTRIPVICNEGGNSPEESAGKHGEIVRTHQPECSAEGQILPVRKQSGLQQYDLLGPAT